MRLVFLSERERVLPPKVTVGKDVSAFRHRYDACSVARAREKNEKETYRIATPEKMYCTLYIKTYFTCDPDHLFSTNLQIDGISSKWV